MTAIPGQVVITDEPCEVRIGDRTVLARGFRPYERISFVRTPDGQAHQVRDVLRAGPAAAVLPLDLARGEVILLRQFRLAAQVANGAGSLIEIVAGHVEAGERPAEAARRECVEEIGLDPDPLIELLRYFTSPGMLDEEITLFLGIVDGSNLSQRGGAAAEHEETFPMRVPIEAALAALKAGALHNGPSIVALQWLALNRDRIAEVVSRG